MRSGSFEDPVKPKGYKKPKSRMRVARSPVYLPTTDDNKRAAAMWLRPQEMR